MKPLECNEGQTVKLFWKRYVQWGMAVCFFGVIPAWAQPCLPGDQSPQCASTSVQLPGLDNSLERPPQLSSEMLQNESADGAMREAERAVPSGTSTWGALAKDYQVPGAGGMGAVNNWLTQEDAARAAINACRENGGTQCMVEATYSNRCIAVALDDKQEFSWHIDVNRDLSIRGVLQTCAGRNHAPCQLAYVGCSYAVP